MNAHKILYQPSLYTDHFIVMALTKPQVYCDMSINGGGYMFVDGNYLKHMEPEVAKNLQTVMDDAVIRFVTHKGEQKYAVVSQLNNYK